METRPCPGCGGSAFAVLPAPSSGPYHLERCRGCGHVVTRPVPAADELPALYGREYAGPGHRRFLGPLEIARQIFGRWRAREIGRGCRPGAVLDVGCGRGELLAALRRRGWTVLGTELTDEAATHARQVLGLPVATGEFERLELPPGGFDVVVMWQTFEHMRDPLAVLARVREVLRPGGCLVVAVPNRESWQARITGPYWFHLDLPRHLHHYSAQSLGELLTAARFRVERVSHFNWEQNPFGWVQSLLNLVTGDANTFYDVIRSAGPVPGPRRLRAALAALLLPVVVPLGVGLALVESLSRRGGTVTVWATT